MANNIVQLQDDSGSNVYPIAGGTTQGAVTKAMLDEGVFEGSVLSTPSDVAYVATANIQDGAVTSEKIDFTTLDKIDIILGGNSLTSTSETTFPLLTIPQSTAAYRPVIGNNNVFDVDLGGDKITIKKDAVIKIYGNIVPDTHTSGIVQFRVKLNGSTLNYTRASIGAYVNLDFATPIVSAKAGDIITFTIQDSSGNATFTNNSYGLNFASLEQIG